jgi:hypothetical protein
MAQLAKKDVKMPKTYIDYCLVAMAGLIFLSALTKIRLLLGILSFQQLWAQALIIVLFVSAGLGLVGLFRQKRWGFIFVYVYISIATFAFSISVVPFLFGLLNLYGKVPMNLLLVTNLCLLTFTAYLHVAKSKENRRLKEIS